MFLIFVFVAICIAGIIFAFKDVFSVIHNGNKITKIVGILALLGMVATLIYMIVEYARSF